MTVETKLDFKKYLGLMFIMTYRKPLMILMSFAGLIMLFGSIFYFLGFDMPFDEPPYLQLILGIAITIVTPFLIYISAYKNLKTNGRLREKIVYDFTEEHMKIIGETFTSELTWGKTYKILELKNWILVYQNNSVANPIPKESFGSNLEQFKQIIKAKPFIKNNFSSVKKYLPIIIISVCILLFALNFILSYALKAEPEEFIIPQNYQGEVIVVFSQKSGAPVEYDDKKRVYQVPSNGILFTQFKWNPGFTNHSFYYLVEGKKVNINEVRRDYSYEANKSDSNITSVIDMGPYFYKNANGKGYLFRADQFIVSQRKNLNNYSLEDRMDSIIEEKFD